MKKTMCAVLGAALVLSGASAVMLALAACDDSCSSGSTSSGSATETPPSPPIPVIRDGQKILTIFNAELARRKVENIKFKYSKGLEHAIQADVQMFVDNGSPEFPSDEGLRLRMEGDYSAKMWEGLNEAGYSAGSTAIFGMLNQYRVGVDFDHEGKHLYSMDRLYPATEAQFQQLVDELIKDYGGVPGLPLRRGPGAGLQQDRPGAPLLGRHRDHPPGAFLRGADAVHAPQAPQQELPRHGADPAPLLRPRGGYHRLEEL